MPLLIAQKRRKTLHSPWWLSGHNEKASSALVSVSNPSDGRCIFTIHGSDAPEMDIVPISPSLLCLNPSALRSFFKHLTVPPKRLSGDKGTMGTVLVWLTMERRGDSSSVQWGRFFLCMHFKARDPLISKDRQCCLWRLCFLSEALLRGIQ